MSTLNQDAAKWRALRREVQVMARAMEDQLRANDHKGGWQNCNVSELILRLYEEAEELVDAALKPDAERVLREAADVANFCMMIADVCGALATQPGEAK